jgi:hypothetical protein
MFAVDLSTWIGVALLTPFWWGMGLLVVALLGDISPSWRVRATRLFNRLEPVKNGPSRSLGVSTVASAGACAAP